MPETEEKTKTEFNIKSVLFHILIFAGTGLICFMYGFFYGIDYDTILFLVVMSLLMCGSIFLVNDFYSVKSALFYLFIVLASGLLPMLPTPGWPVLVGVLIFALFEKVQVACIESALFIMVPCVLAGCSFTDFLTYFLCSIVTISLFSQYKKEHKAEIALILSILSLMLCLVAGQILLDNNRLSFGLLLIPIVNVFITLLLMFVELKIYSNKVANKESDKYMEINDPECPLLSNLRDADKKEYYKSVHTAYLSFRIAEKLGLDADATRSLAYYHNISKIDTNAGPDYLENICKEYDFPIKARELLHEYSNQKNGLLSRECVVVYLSDSVVSSIMFINEKNPTMEIQYDALIDMCIEKRISSGKLQKSYLSFRDLTVIRETLVGEKLYYDFLR